MKQILMIGYGEVGKAIANLEQEAGNNVEIRDLDMDTCSKVDFDVIHVCIPFSEKFISIVNEYLKVYKAPLVIVHSTVRVGTTIKIKTDKALVHSPVRGDHPKLETGLKTFVKYVGGTEADCKVALEHFMSLGIRGKWLGKFKTTELAKLLCTSYYGWNIAFANEVKKLCLKHQVEFEQVYTEWNNSYNEGYSVLGRENVIRPVLTPPEGGIGGHCVFENAALLENVKIKRAIQSVGKKRETL